MPRPASDREAIEAEIAHVRSLGLDELHTLWRVTFRSAPPPAFTKDLMYQGPHGACNADIAIQALASISPYAGDEEKRDKMRAIVTAGWSDARAGIFRRKDLRRHARRLRRALPGQIPCEAGDSQLTM
jgi:hypothetical protein